jgi:hypothetical protein
VKYETRTDEDGRAILKLGMNHEVSFEKGIDVEGIVGGVEMLIQTVVGVSAFELVGAVMEEFTKDG